MSEIVHSYLEDLRNCVMWGNCAGNTTRLDRLHQNRLIQRNLKVNTCISFFNLIAVIKESSREFVSYPENLQSVIDDLVSTLDGSNWFILCDELIPDSYEDTMEDEDYEKLDELAERIFNGDFSTIEEEFSDETTMSGIEHEMIRLSVETINQIDLCYKEFWKQVKLFMEQGSFSTGEGRILGSVMAKIQRPFVVQWNGEENDDVFGNNEQFWEKLRYGAVDLSEKIEQIWSHDVEPGTGQFGFAIYGNPGWGKTILLRQQAYQMANAIMDNNQDELIPVYVKAKVLAEQIELNSNGSFELGVVDHDDDDRIFSISHLENEIEICISSMLKSERELDEKVVRELITGSIPSEDTWGPILFLVDAYDEVPNEEGRINVLNFLHEQDRIHGNKSIITCRFTKKDELELFSEAISNIGGEGSINSLEIHFTEHECQFEMPTKLANAWGTESGKIEFYVSKYWREYENVLNTPLFVGLFCMLISHNEIQAEENSIKIRQVNRVRRRLVREKEVTMPHVQFLTKVINFGLEKNIIDRVELTPKINLAKVKRVFLHVAATFKIFQLKSIDSILKYIERMHDIVLDDLELKIFRENLGVMFVNSENEIQWTHGTLPEVALGMLISEDSEYRNYLQSTYGSILGPRESWWSECLILTLVNNNSGLRDDGMGGLINLLRHELPHLSARSRYDTIRMFKPTLRNFQIHSIDYDSKKNRFDFSIKCENQELSEAAKVIADLYFKSMLEGNPFPLSVENFNTHLRGDMTTSMNFLSQIYKFSKDPYLTDLFLERGGWMRYPDVGVGEFLSKFDGDLSRASRFIVKRLILEPHKDDIASTQIVAELASRLSKYDGGDFDWFDRKPRDIIQLFSMEEFNGTSVHAFLRSCYICYLKGSLRNRGHGNLVNRTEVNEYPAVKEFLEWQDGSMFCQSIKRGVNEIISTIGELNKGDGNVPVIDFYLRSVFTEIYETLVFGETHRGNSIIGDIRLIEMMFVEWGIKLKESPDLPSKTTSHRKHRPILRGTLPSKPADEYVLPKGPTLLEFLLLKAPKWFVLIMLEEKSTTDKMPGRRVFGPHSRT
ncbi:MAG: NACHT domain-containing protein [Candidatus Poseidoniaceae archaeon]